jgi:hypothetical protein
MSIDSTNNELTIDSIVPIISSIVLQNPTTQFTNDGSVTFQIAFSEAVTGVDTSDFSLSGTAS